MSEIINEIFLLNGLSDNEKTEIISLFNESTIFKKGEVIYSANTYKNAIGYVISGTAEALSGNSDGVFMKNFTKGSVFGVAAIFTDNDDYISRIIAKTDVEILFIKEDVLKYIFNKYPKTSLNYISFLTEKVRFLNNKLNLLSCQSAEETVYSYLSNISDSEGNAKIPVSMTLLSKMLGIGRATLYRCFDSLENERKIIRENNSIKVIKNEKNS